MRRTFGIDVLDCPGCSGRLRLLALSSRRGSWNAFSGIWGVGPTGLTASIWTSDADAAIRIGDRVETRTWFQNRCDYLDPELAWTGVRDSGRGCSLSRLGYDALTRPKSFLRLEL